MRYLVLAVPMSQWSWIEEIQAEDPETGEMAGTGRFERVYGLFWTWLHSNFDPHIITGEFKALISETPKQMVKDSELWGIEIMPVSRFSLPDYDAWAAAMRSAMTSAGITYLSGTIEKADIPKWYEDNGLIYSVDTGS